MAQSAPAPQASSWGPYLLWGGVGLAAVTTAALVLSRRGAVREVDAPKDALAALYRGLARRSFRPALPSLQRDVVSGGDAVVRVVSYNVLADGQRYALGGQTYCPAEYLVSSSRYPRVFAELSTYDADVVGLQEAQEGPGNFVDQLSAALGASDGGSLAAMAAGKFEGREGSKHHHHGKEKEEDGSKYRLVFSPRQDLEGREAAYAQWRRGNGEELLTFSGDASLYKSGTLEVVDGSVIPLALLAKEYEQYLRAEMGLRGVSVPAGARLGARDSPVVRGGEPRPTVELEGVEMADGAPAELLRLREVMQRVKKRYDGACVALVRHRATGRLLLHANTHAYYHPLHPDVKSIQGVLLGFAMRLFADARGLHLDGDGDATHEWTKLGLEWRTANPELDRAVGSVADLGSGRGGVHASLPAAEALRVINAAKTARTPIPFVLTGDLNSHAEKDELDAFDVASDEEIAEARKLGRRGLVSGLVQILTAGTLPPSHHDHPARRHYQPRVPQLVLPVAPLRSAYVAARGRDPATTTRTATFSACLDFVFVSPSVRVLAVLDMPYPTTARDPVSGALHPHPLPLDHSSPHIAQPSRDTFSAIPDHVWPSDHVAVGADIQF
jgi:Endonuclease/Exonuclease/phosphatase family